MSGAATRGAGVALGRAACVGELAEVLGGEVDDGGCAELEVRRVVAPADAAESTDLVLVASPRVVDRARVAEGVLLCAPALAERLPPGRRWRHTHPQWVVARILGREGGGPRRGTHATAVVEPGASVGRDVEIAAGALVRRGAVIGDGSTIGAGAVVHGGVRLGSRVSVGDGAVLGRPGFGWVEGPGGERLRMPQLGGVEVGDDVEIGPLCTVDAGTLGPTTIARGAKLDAHVHVGHNAQVGADCLVAAQVGFAGSSHLGARSLVGGQAGFADHVRVGEGARVAGKSGVIGDVAAGATVAGFPAVARGRWLRAMAELLARAERRLPRRR